MIVFYACIGLALLLFLLLFLLGAGKGPETDEAEETNEAHEGSCPPETVQQIFSQEDLAYVRRMRSRSLRRFYISERRHLAIAWIRRTSEELRRAIQSHVRIAREKEDIETATEVKVLLQYVGLRCLCGLLLLSTWIVPPNLLQELAVYASRLSRQVTSRQRRIEADGQAVHGRIASNY